jgi:hypothetical protein
MMPLNAGIFGTAIQANMDRLEYKRQNEQREARAKAKFLEEIESQKEWYQRRPAWWKTPSDKFSFFVAFFTAALALFAIWQLTVMRGQLNAMERDQQPHIWVGDKLPRPEFLPAFGTKGMIAWPWNFTNFGKGPAKNLTIDAFLKIGDGPFKRTPDRTAPGWVGEIPPGRTGNGMVSTEPVYEQAEFNRLNASDFAIRLLLEFQYFGLNNEKIGGAVCMSKFATGAVGIADPGDCKKSREK